MCKNTTETGAACEFCKATPKERRDVCLMGGGDNLTAREMMCKACLKDGERQVWKLDREEAGYKMPDGVDEADMDRLSGGEWLPVSDGRQFSGACTSCGGIHESTGGAAPVFCPWCGAKYKEGEVRRLPDHSFDEDKVAFVGHLLQENPRAVVEFLRTCGDG